VSDAGTGEVAGLAVQRRSADPGGAPRPPVVLVHGAMDRAAAFAKSARHLRGLEVVRYDRRGYGRSMDAGTAPTLDALVEDLLTVMAGTPSCVVGHSIGGTIALAAAARHPNLIVSVGAFEPPLPWKPWWPAGTAGEAARAVAEDGAEAAAEAFMRRMIGDRRWEELPDRTRAQRRLEGPALLADLASLRLPEPPFDADQLAVPVTVGHGSETDARHRRAVEELARTIAGADLVVIDGAPHGAHYSHATEFAAFVERAVSRAPLGDLTS
jgi:pimeloyl-ACP methyl ester carboxylesterase